jgi:threonine dehydrogenase-like Zn-dependent dehydrogenase
MSECPEHSQRPAGFWEEVSADGNRLLTRQAVKELGVDTFATHTLPLDQAPHGYDIFQKKQDGAVKIILKPGSADT